MSRNTAILLLVLFGLCSTMKLTRSKRYSNMFMCGNYPSSFSFPCSNSVFSMRSQPISSYNLFGCNSGCSDINCNQYSGQWINGQYVFGNRQYNPCTSTCCAQIFGLNSYNPYNAGFGTYNLYNYAGIGNGMIPNGVITNSDKPYNPYDTNTMSNEVSNSFTGRFSNHVRLCGGVEPSGGTCHNGQCPNGHICIAGNICCRCAVGASAGICTTSNSNECPVGYSCTPNGQCCATQVTRGIELLSCINNSCEDGYQCGKGNLCYPSDSSL